MDTLLDILREFGPFVALAIYLLWDRREQDKYRRETEKQHAAETAKREERLMEVINHLEEYKTTKLEVLVQDGHRALNQNSYVISELFEIRAQRRPELQT